MKYRQFNLTNAKNGARLGLVIDGIPQTEQVEILKFDIRPSNMILVLFSSIDIDFQYSAEFHADGADASKRHTLVELPQFELDGTPVYIGDRVFSVGNLAGTAFIVGSQHTHACKTFHLDPPVKINDRFILEDTPIWIPQDDQYVKVRADSLIQGGDRTYLQLFQEQNANNIFIESIILTHPPTTPVQQYQAIHKSKIGAEYIDTNMYTSEADCLATISFRPNPHTFQRCIPTIFRMTPVELS